MPILFLRQTYGGDLALVNVGAGGVGGDIAPGDRGEPESSGRGGGPGRETGKHGGMGLVDGEGGVWINESKGGRGEVRWREMGVVLRWWCRSSLPSVCLEIFSGARR
jgi:hypothetical protein